MAKLLMVYYFGPDAVGQAVTMKQGDRRWRELKRERARRERDQRARGKK